VLADSRLAAAVAPAGHNAHSSYSLTTNWVSMIERSRPIETF
jgi:hypothetical protein